MKSLAIFIGTFGFIGYLKPAPGSWGSLAAALIWWFAAPAQVALQLALLLGVILLAVWSSGMIEKQTGIHDPSVVVIDEVAGMWCSLLTVPHIPWYYVSAFIIFRLMDIAKPGPIRRLQQWPGGWGIVMDDLAAGVATLAIMIALRLVL
ncbi:MAG: phosphatidylglycerophosphatase A [Fidelibacterota bacterium]|nr:MAG: phosphatidylglycerophosphatase A [Candidatus Neomarinimicrobiota bacterium]